MTNFSIDLDAFADPIVVYHDDCPDGLTAFWVCLQVWPDAEAYPARYDVDPDYERLAGRNVLIVDFSWKRAAMMNIIDSAASILVLDHHKSAESELAGLRGCFFDMNRSGCRLAWDFLFSGQRPPPIVEYTEDRDLWRWKLPLSREINAAFASYPLTLEWREKLAGVTSVDGMALFANEGEAIIRYRQQLIDDVLRKGVPLKHIGGHRVPCVASPFRELVSDLGHGLSVGYPFACVYFDTQDNKRLFSLRSDEKGLDVSEIARSYGGGGHYHAAGFEMVSPVEFRAEDGTAHV